MEKAWIQRIGGGGAGPSRAPLFYIANNILVLLLQATGQKRRLTRGALLCLQETQSLSRRVAGCPRQVSRGATSVIWPQKAHGCQFALQTTIGPPKSYVGL